MDQVKSVIIAATQSVAKVYVIGAVGWMSAKYPKSHPLLTDVASLARFSFHTLTVALVYSTVSQSISPATITQYWFCIASAAFVTALSYLLATGLAPVFGIRRRSRRTSKNDDEEFVALRIAVTYPNIVALPILIFPSLCEYPIVYQGYFTIPDETTETTFTLLQQCIQESNTMIFTYFFCWSVLFWMHAYPALVHPPSRAADTTTTTTANENNNIENSTSATHQSSDSLIILHDKEKVHSDIISNNSQEQDGGNDESTTARETALGGEDSTTTASTTAPNFMSASSSWFEKYVTSFRKLVSRWRLDSIWRTISSPGCLALWAGIITGCIPGLSDLLYPPGAPLRFLGDAISTMGQASSPVSTMVVAASLVVVAPLAASRHDPNHDQNDEEEKEEEDDDDREDMKNHAHDQERPGDHSWNEMEQSDRVNVDESRQPRQLPEGSGGIMSDPNFLMQQSNHHCHHCQQQQQHPSRMRRLSRSIRRESIRIMKSWQPQPQTRTTTIRENNNLRSLLLWYIFSRLIATPAVVTGIIVGLDCSGWIDMVPNLAKLVVIINSSLPGALIVVVLLQQQNTLSNAAMVVAKVYLPTYLLSIITIAGWTALGLWVTIPDEEGNTICHQ
jgi:hypothetical protein